MDKKKVAVILIVIAVIFLVASVVAVISFTSLGSFINLQKSPSVNHGGEVQVYIEGNEFSEVGK